MAFARVSTAAQAATNNVILGRGELGATIEADGTTVFKIGNGIDHWNDLETAGGGGGGDALTADQIWAVVQPAMVKPASPNAKDDEFDGTTTVTWSDTPTVAQVKAVNTTVPDRLYLTTNAVATFVGLLQAVPASRPWSATTRIDAASVVADTQKAGILIAPTTPSGASNCVLVGLEYNSGLKAVRWFGTVAGTISAETAVALADGAPIWLKATARDSTAAGGAVTGMTATASSFFGGWTPDLAVDGNTGTGWLSNGAVNGEWLQVDLGSVKTISAYSLAESLQNQRSPGSWKLQTSANGSTGWTDVDGTRSETAWTTAQERTYTLATPASARYWRVLFLTGIAGNDGYIGTREFRMTEQGGPIIVLDSYWSKDGLIWNTIQLDYTLPITPALFGPAVNDGGGSSGRGTKATFDCFRVT